MKAIRFGLIAVSILLIICFCSCTSGPQYRVRTLQSGRVVKVMSVMRMNFSQGPPALMLKYQTDLKVSDKDELRKEIDDIWSEFRVEAEKGQFQSAIISANEKPSGFIFTTSSGYNFVFQKRSDGEWHCASDK